MIRREDVWALVGNHVMTVRPGSKLEWVIHRYANAIDGAPEVDAVPVVRCKDCLYFCDMSNMGKGYQCSYHSVIRSDGELENIFYTAPEAYCAWGERRDGDDIN